MIEIIDKINNTREKKKDLEIVIHPTSDQILFIEDFQRDGSYIYSVIFDKAGTLFCYNKLKEKLKKPYF